MKLCYSIMVLAVTTGFFTPSIACSCSYEGPFLELAPKSDVVVFGEVIRHEEHSLYLQVIEVFHGEETRHEIRIWGDRGDLCRPYVSKFPPGTQRVFAVDRVTPTAGREGYSGTEEKTDFAVSVCGEYALPVKGDQVVGYLDRSSKSDENTMYLKELREKLSP